MLTNKRLAQRATKLYVDWVKSFTDPVQRAQAAGFVELQLAHTQLFIATIRQEAVQQLIAEGWSLAEIGAELEISRARVHQIGQRTQPES